ncbi:MAG: YqjK-like family protein [Sulfurimicrobium sp.]
MNSRLIELAEHRERLLARISRQRDELAHHASPLKAVFAVADKGVAAARFLRRHPGLVAGAVGLFVALRPRLALRWLGRGWSLWKVVQKLRQRLGSA